ncbi:hypothetical protein PC116_g7450 [Phytophthora cactorum]|uniref:Uncharacterized protein n=1 Tax=Phytophthora cactorum TaxID=29920 RepID=A0A329S9L0_9STRA|nr:hypothetical protein Pcac1_g19716 [Phytophthora cactorum]KAG2830245.1 hypothetical protein PC112_g7769 [Phytophthora cactorum]KAG2832555.1 hypothetical protein PC111_g6555 [Phytophthora cactorum]KAG2920718.1 hypothetical protein PC114_g5986 [Phytophthora cactorum]KAG2935415.1 hypothetical protein PC115_g4903 [Phytophthora cactorum]
MEISISERLGHITVREDYDMIRSFSKKEIRDSVATDCVDEDELYPYSSFERVRKDISGGIVMTEGRQKKQVTDGVERTDTELVVTVRRTGFLKRHRPEFPVSPLTQQELEAGIGDWGKVMIRAMREVLYARA